MTARSATDALEAKLGHRFRTPDLLTEALTHASIATRARPDNQRLEFLGDRVLGLIIAEALLAEDLEATEGQIAPRFNALVRKETCAEIAAGIGIGEAMVLGRSEAISGGRRKTALLGDAMEAVIAAVYRDAGFEAARKVVLHHWNSHIRTAAEDALDAKTTLQEWAQARGLSPPEYREVARSGPDHAPVFTIEAILENGVSARAEASAKRTAQQAAAQAILAKLEAAE